MNNKTKARDSALTPVALEERQKWYVPALIFAGLEFAIPVMIVGSTLITGMSFNKLFLVLLAAMAIQWVGNALQGYMGAKTGYSSTVISRDSMGVVQSRVVLGLMVGFFTVGWGALQTEIAGNAICALFGFDYEANRVIWAIATITIGMSFAIPAIKGYESMKWADIVAVPAGLILIVTSLYMGIREIGIEKIVNWQPQEEIPFISGISMIIGLNVAQWLIASDYTRYSKPKFLDQALIPFGIICVGIPLLLIGAVMSVGIGQADIVQVMIELKFPHWGYLILVLAVWTSLLVNSYSMGLAASNTFNIHSARGRAWMTFWGTLIVVGFALVGVIKHFIDYLYFLSVALPPIVGVMFANFYLLKRINLSVDEQGKWNIAATIAIIAGCIVGSLTHYRYEIGIVPIQSLATSSIIYVIAMQYTNKTQAKV